ncbi:MAG: polyhydroxybutyrate depolymerase [Actinomycetota bacterium]|nr:polyhydroxybutyrate depolymerase [Actinomycetota bacterium]
MAAASPGCSAATDPTLTPGATATRTVSVDGNDRSYLIHVPPGYDPAMPTPSVVTFHGMGTNAFLQLANSGILASADANGYVVLAPEGQSGLWQLPTGEGDDAADTPELSYLDAVTADADASLCLDPARRYASGMSMGSAMVLVLACQPERTYAAFGGVGASFYRPICDGAPPAPLIYFHGTADDVVPFDGGTARGFEVAPVPQNMAAWAAHNGCQTQSPAIRTDDVELIEWSSCTADADVDYYKIDGGGHTWPGSPITTNPKFANFGGVTTTTVSATDAMWQFFSRYSLPTAG